MITRAFICLFTLISNSFSGQSADCPLKEINIGKDGYWTVLFDSNRTVPIVEIKGVKFGEHDYLMLSGPNLYLGENSRLEKHPGYFLYSNSEFKIKAKLKTESYTESMDAVRYNIFKFRAYRQVYPLLKKQGKESSFDWNLKDDYTFFRSNCQLLKNYKPNYLVKYGVE